MPQECLFNKDEYKKVIAEEINNSGIAIIDAFAKYQHEDLSGLQFAYTIGLFSSFGLPELVIFGKKPSDANHILNFFYSHIKKDLANNIGDASFSLPIKDRVFYEAHPLPVGGEKFFFTSLINIDAIQSICPYMSWFYSDEPFSALQIIYPDSLGLWEWEEGCINKSIVNPFGIPIHSP